MVAEVYRKYAADEPRWKVAVTAVRAGNRGVVSVNTRLENVGMTFTLTASEARQLAGCLAEAAFAADEHDETHVN